MKIEIVSKLPERLNLQLKNPSEREDTTFT
jgi:hypothetical protein